MGKENSEHPNSRLHCYVRDAFNTIPFRHQLPMEINNALVEFRNNLYGFIDAIFAEQKTRDQYGVDVDYIQSEVRRINLKSAESPYWVKGEIPDGRPPGPTNQEVYDLQMRVRKRLAERSSDPVANMRLDEEIVDDIKRTFTIPNENLPFTRGLYDRSPNAYAGYDQHMPCEVCGENRAIDRCHIIPSMVGGSKSLANTIYLCPTHHRLFDRCLLMKEEWEEIDFSRKSKASANYAFYVVRPALEKHWKELEGDQYEKRTWSPLTEANRQRTGEDLVDDLMRVVKNNPGISLKEIEQKSAANYEFIREALIRAKKQGNVHERRVGGARTFYFTGSW